MPIPMDKFKKLPKVEKGEKGTSVAKVSNEELIAKLQSEAMTTKEVSTFLGVQTGTAYSRLGRLEEKNMVYRVMGDDGVQYWGYNEDYTPEEAAEVEEADEEVAEE